MNSFEARQRLAHLQTLPESPARRREIAALERILASKAIEGLPRRKKRANSGCLAEMEELDDDNEPQPPSAPLREVQRWGAHRRVIIRRVKNDVYDEAAEEAQLARERERRRGDIERLIGLRRRGDD